MGDERNEARALTALAEHAADEGRGQDALTMLADAYRLYREFGDLYRGAIMVSRIAGVLASVGRAATAARLLSCSETLHREIGANPPWVAKLHEETLTTVCTQLDEAALAKAWEHGRALTADEAVALALDSRD